MYLLNQDLRGENGPLSLAQSEWRVKKLTQKLRLKLIPGQKYPPDYHKEDG